MRSSPVDTSYNLIKFKKIRYLKGLPNQLAFGFLPSPPRLDISGLWHKNVGFFVKSLMAQYVKEDYKYFSHIGRNP